ncbi:MAG TPA: hypothetical protein P5218_09585 [Planctomycetota bacterium]|nr:hypothetical protein [Planctomycetota bacterium]HRV81677.1 hypothetical protein [Planctomycetota bacterium]
MSATHTPESHTPESLSAHLSHLLGAPVHLEVRRDRSVPVQARAMRFLPFARGGVELKVHELFLSAPPTVHQDMAAWLKVGKRAKASCQRLDHWIQGALQTLPPLQPRRLRLQHQGRVHDLQAIQLELLGSELAHAFEGFPQTSEPRHPIPHITWGRAGRGKKVRSIRLGSYNTEINLVRIHPRLDQPAVPERFVRYIVFHELLHAIYPSQKDRSGRWIHHTPKFKARERQFPDYAFALEWEKSTLFRVI